MKNLILSSVLLLLSGVAHSLSYVSLPASQIAQLNGGSNASATAIQSSINASTTILQAGTVSVTNTVYIVNATTSITGVGWVDTRNAKKVVVSIAYALDTDPAVTLGAGVTLYVDASNQLSTDLANTNSNPVWNMWLGRPQDGTTPSKVSKTPDVFTIYDPPAALRFRLDGVFNATCSIRYVVKY